MIAALRLKRVAGLLLVVSFALPLSRCEDRPGDTVNPPTYTYTYAYRQALEDPLAAVLMVTGFLWPALVYLCERLWLKNRRRGVVAACELPLCLYSAVLLWALNQERETWYGSYLAAAAILVYFVSSARSVGTAWKARLAYRSRPGP